MTAERARVIRPEERRQPTQQTPGMVREEAFASEGLWVGSVETQPGTASAWHHHGGHDTYVYVLSGRLRIESGPGGADAVEAESRDFLHIPAHAIHREIAASDDAVRAVLFRVGGGEVVVNVEGPEPAAGTSPANG